jgi:hypothetical protein
MMNTIYRDSWKTPALLVGITVVALAFRLYRLDAESLWMDEIVTVESSYGDPAGIVIAAAMEGQPPLDNFVGAMVHRLGLGQSDWWVRLPTAIFGAGAILLLGLWVRRLAGDAAGLTAALLLAVCPMHISMSQEVRPYALMFFLVLACGLCYVRAREKNRLADWVIFSAVTLAMLMTRWTDPHVVVMGIGLHALFERMRARQEGIENRQEATTIFRRAAMSTVAACVCYAPFFWIVLHYQSVAIRSPSNDWLARFGSLLYEAFAALFAGYSTRTVFVALPGSRWLVLTGALLTLIGLLVALLRCKRADSAFWWIFLPFPLVYAFVYAMLGNAVPKPQYLLVMAVLVFACIALALDTARACLKRPVLQCAFLAVMLPLLAVPMARASWNSLERIDKRDWRGAMGFLKQHAGPGDVAVCLGSDTVVPAFRPKAYGKDRYGPEQLKFIPISTDTLLGAFADAGWTSSINTVWMLVYTDRMYLGYDQAPPTSRVGNASPTTLAVHAFNGLFLVEVHGDQPAIDRLMDGIAALYKDLPDGRSLIAPAVLRSRWLMSRGDTLAAKAALDVALRQCRSQNEALILMRDVFASPPTASLASTP